MFDLRSGWDDKPLDKGRSLPKSGDHALLFQFFKFSETQSGVSERGEVEQHNIKDKHQNAMEKVKFMPSMRHLLPTEQGNVISCNL